jgi:phenol 2-monooxygenase
LEGIVRAFTAAESDQDSVFNIVLVLSSKRVHVELEAIPEIFTPVTGKWKMKGKAQDGIL